MKAQQWHKSGNFDTTKSYW